MITNESVFSPNKFGIKNSYKRPNVISPSDKEKDKQKKLPITFETYQSSNIMTNFSIDEEIKDNKIKDDKAEYLRSEIDQVREELKVNLKIP